MADTTHFHDQNGVCGLVQVGKMGLISSNLDIYCVDIYI